MLIDLAQVGVAAVQKQMQRELREFRRLQRIKIGKAANFVRNAVRRKQTSTFHRGTGRMRRAVGRKLEGKWPQLVARIQYTRRQYYAIHETGGRIEQTLYGGHRVIKIPPRPIFAPEVPEARAKTAEIMGESFDAFGPGSR